MIEGLPGASRAAAAAIADYVRQTPIELLSRPGHPDQVWAKCENLQVTGSFKVRGALTKLLSLDNEARHRGVITASTGNHGAAVAYGSSRLGIDATVLVPSNADPSKIAMIERWGATVRRIAGDPLNAERSARLAAAEQGSTYVSPYNDRTVVEGQGTVGVELGAQLPRIDTLIVAVGGGGLISGAAAAIRDVHPAVRVIGASPENSNVMMKSIGADQIVTATSRPTLSDGTAGGVEADSITFELCHKLVDGWVAVSEQEIADAVRSHVAIHHQLIEGAAGVALAAAARLKPAGVTAVVLCGANIAPATLRTILAGVER